MGDVERVNFGKPPKKPRDKGRLIFGERVTPLHDELSQGMSEKAAQETSDTTYDAADASSRMPTTKVINVLGWMRGKSWMEDAVRPVPEQTQPSDDLPPGA